MKHSMYCSPIYFDDDLLANSCPIFFRLADAKLADLLKYADSNELAWKIVPLNFTPHTLLEKLKSYAKDGRTALVCIDREKVTVKVFWGFEADDSLRELIRLKKNRGFVLGFLVFPTDGGFVAYPEAGENEPVNSLLLDTFGRGATPDPQVEAADELFKITNLDDYSDWQDRYQDALLEPILFPASSTESGVPGEAH